MLEILKKELNISIITSIAYVILGIFVVTNPATAMNVAGIAFSIMAIVYGVIISIINISFFK